MILKPKLFLKIGIMFIITMTLGIFTANKYSLFSSEVIIPNFQFSSGDIISLAILILFFVFAFKYKKVAHFFFKAFLLIIVFGGAQFIAGAFNFTHQANYSWDLIFAVVVLICFLLIRNVFMHNIGVILGIAGIGALAGLSISPNMAVFFLVILSFYDILAVYKTKHMVQMAKTMLESGAAFGFLIPSTLKGFFSNKKEAHAQTGDQFMILGSGDTAVPLILASSLAKTSLVQAVVVAAFAIVGLFITHLLFINQTKRAPMAALPPIATMAIIGYLVAIFF